MSKKHFENLDGWRFVAACAVILGHCASVLSFHTSRTATWRFLQVFFGSADLAVNFFFVLSGFLITYIILQEKESEHFSLKSFYIRRILRIWGVYYIVVLASILAGQVLLDKRFDTGVVNYFYISTFLANFDVINIIQAGLLPNQMTAVLWSVSVEEQFYLVYPLLLIVFPKKHYVKLFIFIIFLSFLFRWNNIDSQPLLNYHTLSVASDLIVGCLAAYLVFYKKGFEEFFKDLNAIFISGVYVLLALLLLTRVYIFDGILKPFEALIFAAIFAFVILEQNYADKSPFKIKNIPGLNFMGRFTYGCYCYHMGIVILTSLAFRDFVNPANNQFLYVFIYVTYLLTGVLLTLAVSMASYYLIERPLLKLKSRFE